VRRDGAVGVPVVGTPLVCGGCTGSSAWAHRRGQNTVKSHAQIVAEGRPMGKVRVALVRTVRLGFPRSRPMARTTGQQGVGGLGENAAVAAMWAKVTWSGFGTSRSGQVHRSGLFRNMDLCFPKTNFYST
jgi:hypothetical protein